jgi:enamine deaminase RidA (YjgF/YER057c/UK114 family)
MSTNTLKRAHVGKRLSEYAVYNGVVYLAGQVPEVDPRPTCAARRARCWAISTACWPKPAATRRAS